LKVIPQVVFIMAKKKCLESTNGISGHFFRSQQEKRAVISLQTVKPALLLQPLFSEQDAVCGRPCLP
ncbi:hypothetical protein, partial [Faecalibaculum rodentium]|uniref:hypothetical protein n=1 Tax=Faecalibaculum rodentium TaxID=1702221 RepID=UPI00255B090C